jgi:hypothetical protein
MDGTRYQNIESMPKKIPNVFLTMITYGIFNFATWCIAAKVIHKCIKESNIKKIEDPFSVFR